MKQKIDKKLESLDLIIRDLNIIHSDIRVEAKEKECEKELDEWKVKVIEYLMDCRSKLS